MSGEQPENVEKRTIGQILVSMGRISEDDVASALAHQREHGGFFGEALIACGLVTEDELEFGLASQFDLPYVFPEAEAIDPEAAAIVSPEWALAHLTLPILMTADSLKVIVESPLRTTAVDELRLRTDKEIELALASGSKIRELIRQVYARAAASDEEKRPPADVEELVDELLSVEAARFGVSVRGTRAVGWYDERGTTRRRPLSGDWASGLEGMLIPPPSAYTEGVERTTWEAELHRAGVSTPVSIRYLADESGSEILFHVREVPVNEQPFEPAPDGIVSEVGLLARSGTARFIVTTEPEELGHDLVPHLPGLLLDPTWRSIYLNADPTAAASEAFSLALPDDPELWAAEMESLRSFHFDVVTVDLSGEKRAWAEQTLDVAAVAFLLWGAEDDTRPAYEAGIRWRLHVRADEAQSLEWSLEPLHA